MSTHNDPQRQAPLAENDEMTMTALARFQSWYLSMCDGDWEHCEGITITTLDNPGWSTDISLRDTPLEQRSFTSMKIERSDNDWLHAWIDEKVFKIRCGPGNLE